MLIAFNWQITILVKILVLFIDGFFFSKIVISLTLMIRLSLLTNVLISKVEIMVDFGRVNATDSNNDKLVKKLSKIKKL